MDPGSAADRKAPPSKKPRLEALPNGALVPEPEDVIDDMDDLYGTSPVLPESPIKSAPQEPTQAAPSPLVASAPVFQLPGLGLSSDILQHQVNGNGNDSAMPSLVSEKVVLRNDTTNVDAIDDVGHTQGVGEGEELGIRAATVQILDTTLSNAPTNAPDASMVFTSMNPDYDLGQNSEPLKDTSPSEEGVEDTGSKSDAPLPPQSLESPTHEDSAVEIAQQGKEPASEITNIAETTCKRGDDRHSVNGVLKTSSEADQAIQMQQPSSIRMGPSTSNTIEVSNTGEHILDAEAGLSTALKELPEADEALGEPEFEIDSSPIESSSSETSTDSSSSDDSDDDYEMLDPEEEARRLMAEDIGSDGEGASKVKGTGIGHVRTLNEKPDEIVEKPNITVTTDMKIEELGSVENLVDNLALIKANISGEYQVLETGSVICLEDKTVIGVIAETLGRVQQPFYSVRFTNAAAISEIGISKGTKIFYVEQHSTYVFTQVIKAIKGSDASNLHDEEVGDDELEFSDDEAEAEHKRRVKTQRQSRREARAGGDRDGLSNGPRQGGRGGNRGGNGFQDRNIQDRVREFNMQHGDAAVINYDDKSDDGELYTPLVRPSNLYEMMGNREAPLEGTTISVNNFRDARGGNRGRGDHGRGGRGDRGRGRGGKGGGGRDRGGFSRNGGGIDRQARRSYTPPTHSNGDRPSYAQYDHNPPQHNSFAPPASYAPPHMPPSYQSSTHQPPYPPPPNHYHNAYAQAYPQAQYQQSAQHFPQHGYGQQHHPLSQNYYQPQQQHPQLQQTQQYNRPPNPSDIPPGAYVNPAFFANANTFVPAGRGRGVGPPR